MPGKFLAFPTRFRHAHRLPRVYEQVFDIGTSDIARSKGLQIMSIKIFAGGGLASLSGLFLSQPLPATHLFLCHYPSHFVFTGLLSVLHALRTQATHTRYVAFRDIKAPTVTEATAAKDMTTT